MQVTIDLPEGYTVDDIKIPKTPIAQKRSNDFNKIFHDNGWHYKREVDDRITHIMCSCKTENLAKTFTKAMRIGNRTNFVNGTTGLVAFENEKEVDFAFEVFKDLYDVLERYAKKGIEEKFPT